MTLRADVVIPLRNGAAFLAPALQSILDDPALGTLFIVDDGSTDAWEAAAEPYLSAATRKIVILRQKPSGLAAALNRGLTTSTASYIARMDADDISLPGRLNAQATWLERHPHIAAVGSQVTFIREPGGAPLRHSKHPTTPHALRHELFARGHCTVCHPTVMLRREAVLSAGGYRESFLHAEDYDLWLRLSEKGAIANLDACHLKYRIHPNQVSQVHKVRQSFSRDVALFAARERTEGRPDPTLTWNAPRSYSDLHAPVNHPVIQKLAIVYEAIDQLQNGKRHSLTAEAARAIPSLARQGYLGDARRIRYALITKAGAAALKHGNLGDALKAYYALARCRATDSRYFRNRFAPNPTSPAPKREAQ